MTKITIPDTADLLARIARPKPEYFDARRSASTMGDVEWANDRIKELEAERDALKDIYDRANRGRDKTRARAERAEAALDEIIMESTSRNHAIDIARRARAEGGE